jgi:SAM-dependent methyltransferase
MKRYAPATARNREPIAEVLAEELPERGLVLEIASGSGEHAVHFARLFPGLAWQPSDPDADARASIEAWGEEAGLANVRPAIELDAAGQWPIDRADAILCVNMTHISPPEATRGLFAGAGRVLAPGAPLIVYGPFIEREVGTAPSNLAFDADLKRRNPAWGLRDARWLDELAEATGLERTRRVAMPANNLTLVYRRK